MQRSSSPFLEQPSKFEDGVSYSREKFSRLEYELNSLKTEQRLLEQSKQSSVAKYEDLLAKKNTQLAQLQSNFDYVYKQRQDLQSKLKNQSETTGKASSDLSSRVKTLSSENKSLKVKLDKYERSYQTTTAKCEHLRADLNRELSVNDQYRDRIKALEGENAKLTQANDSLLSRMKSMSSQADSDIHERKLQDCQMRLLSLQKTNNELQFRFDQLLQQKTSVELLKQKNASLAAKVQSFEKASERVSELELVNAELRARFDEYFGVIAGTMENSHKRPDKDVVSDFVQSFKQLQNKNIVLYEKLSQTQLNETELSQKCLDLQAKIESTYGPQIESLKEELKQKSRQVSELSKLKILNAKEIEFLRKSLKDMDEVTTRHKTSIAAPDAPSVEERNAMNQYLSSLEKLVDDYKREIEQMRKESVKSSFSSALPTKRPRIIDDEDSKTNAVHSLRTENLDLLTKIRTLEDHLSTMNRKLQLAEEASKQPAKGNIVELRANPFSADQLIKQETLSALRKENTDLIAKYIESRDVEMVPRSVFARQENDKDLLQNKVDQLVKKNNRLKSVYSDKSREIIALISKYFGYTIEFIPSPINPNDLCSKIKLISRYMAKHDSEESLPYLIIDVHSRGLKANGNHEFKNMCEELVSQWVSEKNQIPCFLSALNLRIYEDYSKRRCS